MTGALLWITGLSGAGKTTVAKHVVDALRGQAAPTLLLDGDAFREVMGHDLGHDLASRRLNAMRLSRFSKLVTDQGIHVVCATMSLFDECRAWNRANVDRYLEVYVRVPMDVLVRRDPRGTYARALTGVERNVVGVDLPFEEPRAPDLVLDNAPDGIDPRDHAIRILGAAGARGLLPFDVPKDLIL